MVWPLRDVRLWVVPRRLAGEGTGTILVTVRFEWTHEVEQVQQLADIQAKYPRFSGSGSRSLVLKLLCPL